MYIVVMYTYQLGSRLSQLDLLVYLCGYCKCLYEDSEHCRYEHWGKRYGIVHRLYIHSAQSSNGFSFYEKCLKFFETICNKTADATVSIKICAKCHKDNMQIGHLF